MKEPIKISTGDYNKQGKVEVDGHVWTVKLPGAGTEMRLSQTFRSSKSYGARLANLEKKIDAGEASNEELDQYDKYSEKYQENEQIIFDFFIGVFKDDTEDNSEVKKWVEETPSSIIQLAFENIKSQANGKEDN